jgi:hypothetical protein
VTRDRPTDPAAIGVVIPARDEAARIDRCLTAVRLSAAALARQGRAPGGLAEHLRVLGASADDAPAASAWSADLAPRAAAIRSPSGRRRSAV